MCSHAAELLRVALDPTDLPHSTKAYNLLIKPNNRVFRALLDRSVFHQFYETVLLSETPPIMINRFAVVLTIACLALPDIAAHKLSAIDAFLDFLDLRSVFDMFCAFFANDARLNGLQNCLKKSGLFNKLFDRIGALPAEGSLAEAAVSLFAIVPFLTVADNLADQVTTERLSILLRSFVDPPVSVLDVQFEAVAAVAAKFPEFPSESIPRVLLLVTNSDDRISRFFVLGLGLIQQLIALPEHRQLISSSGLAAALTKVLRKFPRHTITHNAIGAFVLEASKFPEFADLTREVAQFADQSIRGETVEERGFAFGFFRALKDQGLVSAEGLRAFRSLDAAADAPYGGDLPQEEATNFAALNEATVQRFMQMFGI
jgi:hypothetical protein